LLTDRRARLGARADHRVVDAVDDVVERNADAASRPGLPGDERDVAAGQRAADPRRVVVGPAVEVVADRELPAERRLELRDRARADEGAEQNALGGYEKPRGAAGAGVP